MPQLSCPATNPTRTDIFWILRGAACPDYGIIAETSSRNGAIMRPTEFSADTIIARASRRTAFRKLKDIDARTSYSHRGGFYTLDELAHFDERGLWSFAGVRFSRAGTLIATANSFVNHAEAGHFVDELDNLLGVGTQDALRKLVGDGRLTRHKLAGQFLYCVANRAHQTHQVRARRLLMATPGLVRPLPDADLMPEELRAAMRNGGAPRAASTIPRPERCRSWPTAAAAIVPRRAPGSTTCNTASATGMACA